MRDRSPPLGRTVPRHARRRWRLRCAVAAALGVVAAEARASETVTPPPVPPAGIWIPTAGGEIRVLDKQKAESRVIPLKLGATATFETLSITLRACMVHAPGVPPDQAGFVEIVDRRAGEPGFKGWMLAHEPGLAMLESPVYAVRVGGCETATDAAIAAALPPPPPPEAAPASTDATPTDAAPQAAAPDQALSAPPAPDLEPGGNATPPPAAGDPDTPALSSPPSDDASAPPSSSGRPSGPDVQPPDPSPDPTSPHDPPPRQRRAG